jgi:hypothetical protein
MKNSLRKAGPLKFKAQSITVEKLELLPYAESGDFCAANAAYFSLLLIPLVVVVV